MNRKPRRMLRSLTSVKGLVWELALGPKVPHNGVMSIYDFEVTNIGGERVSLGTYRGTTLLIVNTASYCGYTPQFKGLQELHTRLGPRGFSVLGFPCNQFGEQDPGTDAEIGAFCEREYNVTFPMFAKVEVNGSVAHPLFQYLKEQAPGILGTTAIKWNFTKFLVDGQGNVVERFAPNSTPEEISKSIELLLT
jgi:glutathione peroxidase